MKKLLIVDPYLDVFGGGEKHILSIGKIFEENGYKVYLFWDDESILDHLQERLQINTENFEVEKNVRKGDGYDYLLYVTDGSYFFPKAKKNYVFCMYPQKSLYSKSLINTLKWKNFNFFANSHYTASYINDWTRKKIEVIYPFIENEIFEQYSPIIEKKKIILSVGRFFSHLHAKNQHLLIEAFNNLQRVHTEFSQFSLVLIGGVKDEDTEYFKLVEKLAKENKSIVILKNASQKELSRYYHDALFYWHAGGVGANLAGRPEETEHLGISVAEAMSSGCITFAHNSGGPKEVIKNGETGFLYETLDGLVQKTNKALKKQSDLSSISQSAFNFCNKTFSYNVFKKNVTGYFIEPVIPSEVEGSR